VQNPNPFQSLLQFKKGNSEMTSNPGIPPGLLPEAVDLRRAAALIKHANPDRMDLAGPSRK
jgi:hypothetical protein